MEITEKEYEKNLNEGITIAMQITANAHRKALPFAVFKKLNIISGMEMGRQLSARFADRAEADSFAFLMNSGQSAYLYVIEDERKGS
ncbi:MAG: hypothetical protein LIO99_08845 [Clostridiales bacterium]|nr:hypothetical protein [Clostridiales bacterium]